MIRTDSSPIRRTPSAREILDNGAKRIESELAGQPLVLARLLEPTFSTSSRFSPAQLDSFAHFLELLASLRAQRGTTLILVTHDPEIARAAERLARQLRRVLDEDVRDHRGFEHGRVQHDHVFNLVRVGLEA